ncbi:hypothetical protein B9N43_16435 [Denitratisoma sp. DHT3]|uniref:TetR/AcrR family transcriptional regulator n=1 Tax=Denitratisoma sp. DHT3 TaxID=1981880 RepID=UPI0011987D85|nr:TetR/AcrR family transcriptional regulator [Denitratisoma sp. DHT3]QDX82683.1 hypothetical protein B9N43_16435 [Denitratisoma sp. DHT3]
MTGTKPKTSKTVKGEARELILRAAQELIAIHGVDGVSTRSINQAAGVSASILHYHFGNLEGVVEALLQQHMQPLMEERKKILLQLQQQPDVTVRAIVDAIVVPLARKLIEEGKTGLNYVRLLARLYSDHNPVLSRVSNQYVGQNRGIVFQLLCRALPHLPPDALEWRIFPMAHGLLQTLADPDLFATCAEGREGERQKWDRIENLVDFLCGGLAAPCNIKF